jgi:thiamine pyrophosphokinase
VVVVIGGGPLSPRALAAVAPGAVVIAADSGLDHAVEAGLAPTVLVGDLDSLSAAGRMWAYAHDVRIDEFPADKDATDTELALAEAAAVASAASDTAAHLLVLGGRGDRLDHTLGTIVALGSAALASFSGIRAVLGDSVVMVLHPAHGDSIDGPGIDEHNGGTFTLLALHGRCTGVTVTGARWPLTDATIEAAATLGVSNEATTTTTHISVAGGVLTVVIP